MSLYDDVLAGLVMTSATRPEGNPIDTVSIIPNGLLVGFGTWWRLPIDARQDAFRPVYGRLERFQSGWRLTDRPDGVDVHLLPPEEADEIAALDEMANARRMFKDKYLEVLGHLRDQMTGVEVLSMREWINHVERLEPLDPARLALVPSRQVGRVLLEQDGDIVSVLLFDAHGDYEVFGLPDTWLESIGSEWAREPVDMLAFQKWVRGKTPYGPRNISRIDSLTSDGPLTAIAPPFHPTTV